MTRAPLLSQRGSAFVPLLLGAACMASALVVVQIEHHSRQITTALTYQRHLRDELHLKHAQLQLEEATLGGHSRVEHLAKTKFGMVEPRAYVIVRSPQQAPGGSS